MNDLGMMVDLSHASHQTMRDVLQITKSPVLFSHSNAYSVCNNTRNVPDDVLDMVKANGGAVCVNFVSFFVCQSHYNAWVANGATNNNRKPYNDWFARHNSTDTPCTIKDVVPHIKYLATKLGIDHVCIGPDFPAVMNAIDNVGDLHLLTTELDKEFSPQDVDKITSRNIVRVWGAVEQRQTSIR
jgi:membrane dipeptidase